LLLFLGLLFSAWVLASIIAILTGYIPDLTDPLSLLIGQLLTSIPWMLVIYLSRRYIDMRSFTSLGFERSRMWIDLLAGFFISAVTMGAIFLIFRLVGWLEFEGFAWQQEQLSQWLVRLLIMFVMFVVTGVQEETFFRGYVFVNLEDGLNVNWGLVLSSLMFAILHYTNPGGQGVYPMAGLMLAGVFFGFSYLSTRTLWLAIGLHIGWNFFENTIFGFHVSGLQTAGLIRQTVFGPDLWTGGTFGPEAGLVILPGLMLAGFLVFAYTRGRNI
jgi:membrane protease YdiL (CAAX protease family)